LLLETNHANPSATLAAERIPPTERRAVKSKKEARLAHITRRSAHKVDTPFQLSPSSPRSLIHHMMSFPHIDPCNNKNEDEGETVRQHNIMYFSLPEGKYGDACWGIRQALPVAGERHSYAPHAK
jgi:hypothetical protein